MKIWVEITYPFLNINGFTVEVWDGISKRQWSQVGWMLTHHRDRLLSKLKVPLFLTEWPKRSRCPPPPPLSNGAWRRGLASTPWAMSLYFKFRAMYFWLLNEYWWWDHATICHIIRWPSYRFMCGIMTWSDDKTKLIQKNISTRIRLQALKP